MNPDTPPGAEVQPPPSEQNFSPTNAVEFSSCIQPVMTPSSIPLDGGITRRRTKFPKESTDYLKAWLHRHANHPYPSETEKQRLCRETGLTMTQLSDWMVNARRRILPPDRRPSGSTILLPPAGRRPSLSGLLNPLRRRASTPGGPATAPLYNPLTLQTRNHRHHHSSSYPGSSTRHIVSNMPPRPHSLNVEYAPSSYQMDMYSSGQASSSGRVFEYYPSSEVEPLMTFSSNNPFPWHTSNSPHSPGPSSERQFEDQILLGQPHWEI